MGSGHNLRIGNWFRNVSEVPPLPLPPLKRIHIKKNPDLLDPLTWLFFFTESFSRAKVGGFFFAPSIIDLLLLGFSYSMDGGKEDPKTGCHINFSLNWATWIDRYLSWWLLVGRVENWAASTNWSRLDCYSTALMIERCCYPIKLLCGCTHVNYLDQHQGTHTKNSIIITIIKQHNNKEDKKTAILRGFLESLKHDTRPAAISRWRYIETNATPKISPLLSSVRFCSSLLFSTAKRRENLFNKSRSQTLGSQQGTRERKPKRRKTKRANKNKKEKKYIPQ